MNKSDWQPYLCERTHLQSLKSVQCDFLEYEDNQLCASCLHKADATNIAVMGSQAGLHDTVTVTVCRSFITSAYTALESSYMMVLPMGDINRNNNKQLQSCGSSTRLHSKNGLFDT
eukprot:224757-Amphidinium_carterae.2